MSNAIRRRVEEWLVLDDESVGVLGFSEMRNASSRCRMCHRHGGVVVPS